MRDISNIFVNNTSHSTEVGYASLFEKDHMVFPNRINSNVNEHAFQISINKGTMPIEKWHAHEEKSIEQVAYYSPKDPKDPSTVITKVEFEGWRRYVEERRPTEGGRIIFHVRDLQKQSKLARMIDVPSFREIGWMEPIVTVQSDPILAVNFRETAVEDNPNYIDDLFAQIHQIEPFPNEIRLDLKHVIALNSVDRFKKRMEQCGFSEYEYEEAIKQIRPSSLKEVVSPFYVAALFCRNNGKFKEARKLLRKIGKSHWQYEEARNLERSLYEQEIRENKQKYEQVIKELKDEVMHLRSRGSIPNQTSAIHKSTATVQAESESIVVQQAIERNQQLKIETEKQTINTQLTKRLTETPFGKEIIPYFQGLLSIRQKTSEHNQQNSPDTPKTSSRRKTT